MRALAVTTRIWLRLVAVFLFCWSTSTQATAECAANPSNWEGVLVVKEALLSLRMSVVPQQGCAVAVRLVSVSQGNAPISGAGNWSDDEVHLRFEQIRAEFKGSLTTDGRKVFGSWEQLGESYPLEMRLSEEEVHDSRRAQALPDSQLTREELTIGVSGGVTLSTILLRAIATPQPSPAVIIASGFGAQPNQGDVAGKAIYNEMAEAIARAGIAVYVFDARGVGASTGSYWTSNFMELVGDYCAVVRHARSDPRIVAERIVLVGHSSGAIAAAACAREVPPVKAVLLLAPPGATGATLALEQVRSTLLASQLSEEGRTLLIRLHEKLFAVVAEEPSEGERLLSALERVLDDVPDTTAPDEHTQVALEVLRGNLPTLALPVVASYLRLDPIAIYSGIPTSIRVGVIYGDKDLQVPCAQNFPLVQAALHAHQLVTLRTLPHHNHIFQLTAGSGEVSEYYTNPDGVSELAARSIAATVSSLLSAR